MRVVAGEFKRLTYGETTVRRNYPSGAAYEVRNMIFESDSTVRRRPGLKLLRHYVADYQGRPGGVSHRIGDMHIMFGAQNGRINNMFVTEDTLLSLEYNDINAQGIWGVTTAPLTYANSVGPGAAIGDWHILPIANSLGNPVYSPAALDVITTQDAVAHGVVQALSVDQNSWYQIIVTYRKGGAVRSATIRAKTPVLEYPNQLDISDIPAILGNGQANPQYSQQVAARQAAHAQARARWIETTSKQVTLRGLVDLLVAGANGNGGDPNGSGAAWERHGDFSGLTVMNLGTSVGISAGAGGEITNINYPGDWKAVTRYVNSQDQLPSRGYPNQIVEIGKTGLTLQADPGGPTWREIPRMQVTGFLSLVALRLQRSTNGAYSYTIKGVSYGDLVPLPTSATRDMTDALQRAGAPIRTMYISGRFCVICEHGILVSSASKPLDFFPKSSAAVTPGDGAVIEISASSDEVIVDALPVRSGALILTNTGAYVINIADITRVSIQKVRDTAFPADATHNLASINGDIWHYWRTRGEHSIRIYAESAQGTSWISQNPIPQFDLTSVAVPAKSSLVGTSSGDTVYLTLGDRIKVLTRNADGFSVTTIDQRLGQIIDTAMSGDSLIIFIEKNNKLSVVQYDKNAPSGHLDGYTRLSVQGSPFASMVYGDGIGVRYTERNRLGHAQQYAITGEWFNCSLGLLTPLENRLSTPSARNALRDVTVRMRFTKSVRLIAGGDPVDYLDKRRGEVFFSNNQAHSRWAVTHPVYREGVTGILIGTVGGELTGAPLEILEVSYTCTVYGEKTPSAWD